MLGTGFYIILLIIVITMFHIFLVFSFMQFYSDPTSKMKYMELTFLDHPQNFLKEKKSMKLSQSLSIDEEGEDINIL